MSGPSTYEPKTGFTKWLDDRLPIIRLGHDSFVDFPTPRNLNYWWTFGGILADANGSSRPALLVTAVVSLTALAVTLSEGGLLSERVQDPR